VALFLVGSACAGIRDGSPPDRLSRGEYADLLRIGDMAVQAVMAGDLERFLLHAPRLRDSPASWRGMSADLRAYLFRDVRRVIAAARCPMIRARKAWTQPDGTRHAQLVFFDGAETHGLRASATPISCAITSLGMPSPGRSSSSRAVGGNRSGIHSTRSQNPLSPVVDRTIGRSASPANRRGGAFTRRTGVGRPLDAEEAHAREGRQFVGKGWPDSTTAL
jgi:hypothetical protein